MAEVRFEEVSRQFTSTDRPAVDQLSLGVADGEFLVLVGPSGCGKTTSLRMLAGLETVDSGTIRIGSRDVTEAGPGERDVAMVFQNYALYPHMSVADNMGFALKMAGVDKAERERQVHRVAGLLDLSGVLDRRPRALSGGQRQRVAMGRAIVRQPEVFLMDEPLSNLDAQLRVRTRAEIHGLQRELGVTTVYVTHDQVEAMTMGDRVAVMRDGVLQQVGTPDAVYNEPVNQFVAGFIGSPAMNLFEAVVRIDGEDLKLEFGEHTIGVADSVRARLAALTAYRDRVIILGIRPEDLADAELVRDAPQDTRIRATCTFLETLGSDVLIHFHPLQDTSTRLIARVSPKTNAQEGAPIEFAVDTSRMHFFDPETGQSVAS